MASATSAPSKRILHNSFWYGLETAVEAIVFLGTSIAVARYLGPQKLGYFSYINFFVTVLTRTTGAGLSLSTRKYMSEFLAVGQPGKARSVYNLTHRYQLIGSVTIAALGMAGIFLFGDPTYRLMSSILIISIIPALMSTVPAQANQAFEDVSNNTRSAFGYAAVYVVIIALTIHFHWDLIGIAAASLVGRIVEVFLRTVPLNKTLRAFPLDSIDKDTVQRIRRFCVQALGLQLLISVVWDRSEMFFLRAFSSLEQVAFYSVSFTFATNLSVFPRVFGTSTQMTLMTEAVRNPERVEGIVRNACRYVLLILVPMSLGAAAVTLPGIRLAYGLRYLGAVPAMIVAAILVVPRAFQQFSEILLKASDRQNTILVWYAITGVVNVALDLLLIPHYGAVGAAWGNGLAQTFAAVAIWQQGKRYFTISFPIQSAVRITIASGIMAAAAYFISHRIAGFAGLTLAILTAVPLFLVLLKLLRGLEPSDRQRLAPIGNRFPAPVRRAYLATIDFVTAPAV